MNFSVEGILVATLLILPGFLSSSIQRYFVKDRGSEAQWVAVSALRSLGLNAATSITLVALVKLVEWDLVVQEFTNQLKLLTVQQVGLYLLVLYGFALLYGLAMGLLWRHGRRFAFAQGWTPVSPFDDVFNDALAPVFRSKANRRRRNTDDYRRPWIRIALDDQTEVMGLLARSSVRIAVDKPFEVFLDPLYVRDKESGAWRPPQPPDGTEWVGAYMRVEPKTPMLVFAAPEVWRPSHPGAEEDQAAPPAELPGKEMFFFLRERRSGA